MIKILVIPADNGGCGNYRLIQPYETLDKSVFNVTIKKDGFFSWDEILECDIMVLQRQFKKEMFNFVLNALNIGKKVIYDLDDDIFNIEPSNIIAYKEYNKPEVQYNFKMFLNVVTHITTSTNYLKSVLSKYTNRPITVIPNLINIENWNKYYTMKKVNQDKIIIGWAGSSSHLGDFKACYEAIIDIISKYENVYFKFIGQSFKNAKEFLPYKNKIIETPWKPFNEFGENLADVDIGIIPLSYNKFNQSKSNIKYLEYSIMGIPTIATDILTYNQDIIDNINGYLVGGNCKSNWIKYLDLLINDKNKRLIIANNARQYIIDNYNLADKIHLLSDLLINICNK